MNLKGDRSSSAIARQKIISTLSSSPYIRFDSSLRNLICTLQAQSYNKTHGIVGNLELAVPSHPQRKWTPPSHVRNLILFSWMIVLTVPSPHESSSWGGRRLLIFNMLRVVCWLCLFPLFLLLPSPRFLVRRILVNFNISAFSGVESSCHVSRKISLFQNAKRARL